MNYVVCIWIGNKASHWQRHNTLCDGSDRRRISAGTQSVNEPIGFWTLCPWRGVPRGPNEIKDNKTPLKQTFRLLLHPPVLLPGTQGARLFFSFLPWQTQLNPTPQLSFLLLLLFFFIVLCENQARSLLTGVTTVPLHLRLDGRQTPPTNSTRVSPGEIRRLVLSYFLLAHRLSFNNMTV